MIMKMKNIFMLLVVMLTTVALAACSDSDNDNSFNPNIKGLSVSPEEISFERGESSKSFLVQSPNDISVTSDADWVNITVGEKKGIAEVATVTVNLDENPYSIERTATITITSGSESKTVTVTQSGNLVDVIDGEVTMDAAALAKVMYPGWNLGNTLEAPGGEIAWQSTVTTQAIISKVKELGFNSVRIPCAWNAHMDESGTIDSEWINRVRDIVNYCVNAGLYVVLNDHWDNGWIEVLGFSKSSESYVPVKENYIKGKEDALKAMWTQIANAFASYGDHLLFAGLNEPFQEYDLFNGRHEELTPILCRYNKAFVEAVRATGGNNAKRTLVVQGPSTDINSSCQYMTADKLPEEAGALMVEVHYYNPGQFCGTFDASGTNAFYYWGAANHGTNHNATYGEESEMQSLFGKLNTTYTSLGYPVIIGEYAGLQRTLTTEQGDQAKHDASVEYYYKCLNQYAINNGIIPFAWDTNDPNGLNGEAGSSTILDRAKLTLVGTNAMAGIKAGVAAGTWPY